MNERNSDRLLHNSFRDGDPRMIDMGDPSERAYWCKALGIDDAQLVTLVAQVGNSAQNVRDALRTYPPSPAGGAG